MKKMKLKSIKLSGEQLLSKEEKKQLIGGMTSLAVDCTIQCCCTFPCTTVQIGECPANCIQTAPHPECPWW